MCHTAARLRLNAEHPERFRQVYGKEDLFDAERVVDLLEALETFTTASSSAQGELGKPQLGAARCGMPCTPR